MPADMPAGIGTIESALAEINALDPSREDFALAAETLARSLTSSVATLRREAANSDALIKIGLKPLFRARWGQRAFRPGITLAHIRTLPPTRLLPAALTDWLLARANARSVDEQNAWLHAHTAGVLAETYLHDYIQLTAANAIPDDTSAPAILQRLPHHIDRPSLRHLLSILRDPDPLLICISHSGNASILLMALKQALGPRLLLSGYAGINDVARGRVSTSDPVRAMYHLVKHLRQAGNVALIDADGNDGDSKFNVDVAGLPLSIALGAPHIAFHAKARTVFIFPRWRDNRIAFDADIALRPDKGETIAAWTNRWATAYAAFLTHILDSGPENLGAMAGFLTPLFVSIISGASDGPPAAGPDTPDGVHA